MPVYFLIDRSRIEALFGVAKFERHRVTALPSGHGTVEARAPTGVAGARALLFDLQPKRVLVAIDAQFDHALDMAGRLALLPKRLARTAVVPGLAACDGFPKRFFVHVRDHQHVARFGVGHNSSDQSVGVEFRREGQAFFDVVRG